MSAITLFNFEGSQVRVSIDTKGEPWFVAKDIAEILGYVWNGSGAIRHVPERWRGTNYVFTRGGSQPVLTLSEAGLNFFVMRSDKPKALQFQEWIAGEVLPAIRKIGSFSLPMFKSKALLVSNKVVYFLQHPDGRIKI